MEALLVKKNLRRSCKGWDRILWDVIRGVGLMLLWRGRRHVYEKFNDSKLVTCDFLVNACIVRVENNEFSWNQRMR